MLLSVFTIYIFSGIIKSNSSLKKFFFFWNSKAVTCLAFAAEGFLLVSGAEDGMIRVWDTKSRNIIRILKHAKGINLVILNNACLVAGFFLNLLHYSVFSSRFTFQSSSTFFPPLPSEDNASHKLAFSYFIMHALVVLKISVCNFWN